MLKNQPIPPFFFLDEKGDVQVSHNNQKIDIEIYKKAIQSLEKFVSDISPEDILEWNEEVSKLNHKEKKLFIEKKEGVGHVYVIRDKNFYKIGSTKNLVDRMKNYNTHNPNEIVLELYRLVNNYQTLEKLLHETFSAKRVRGEWFELTSSDLDEIQKIMEKAI
jgi:hypothetical protein